MPTNLKDLEDRLAAVRVAIFDALERLPEPYTRELYGQKCELVYQHVYEVYRGGEQFFQ